MLRMQRDRSHLHACATSLSRLRDLGHLRGSRLDAMSTTQRRIHGSRKTNGSRTKRYIHDYKLGEAFFTLPAS